jgi:hypothetical protein
MCISVWNQFILSTLTSSEKLYNLVFKFFGKDRKTEREQMNRHKRDDVRKRIREINKERKEDRKRTNEQTKER